jgi:hypothetical protein
MRCSEPRAAAMTSSQHVYEVCPRKDHRGVDRMNDRLSYGRGGQPAKFFEAQTAELGRPPLR